MSVGPIDNVRSVFRKTIEEGPDKLAQLLIDSDCGQGDGLPSGFIRMTIDALRTNEWDRIGRAFLNGEFIGAMGVFLFIAPYTLRRNGITSTKLTGVYGEVIEAPPPPDFPPRMQELFGITNDIPKVMPFRCFAAFGHADVKQGEAFLVPDAWAFTACECGPALNNMTAQDERFRVSGQQHLSTIFSEASSDLLIKSIPADSFTAHLVRHKEFVFHEAGHASGIPLPRKLVSGWLPTPWHGGVEEWRADGVEFELLSRMCTREEAGRIIAVNYCLRFGVDAHRPGNVEQDADVVATMFTFQSLLNSKAIYINDERKVCFAAESFGALASVTQSHRESALQLTHKETALGNTDAVIDLYGSVNVDSNARRLFHDQVRLPCSLVARV